MARNRVVLFDVDGVLLDTMPIWENSANLYLEKEHGIIAHKELDRECAVMSLLEAGAYMKRLYPQIGMTPEELAQGVAEFIRERYIKASEKPGMAGAIRLLYENGYCMYLATASDKENVRGALSNLSVWDCFRGIYTCTEIGYSKSYPEYYEEIAGRIGSSCKELVMVEDSLHSMVSAKKAGLTVAGIYEKSAEDKEQEIRRVCDVYFKKLDEFAGWLMKS